MNWNPMAGFRNSKATTGTILMLLASLMILVSGCKAFRRNHGNAAEPVFFSNRNSADDQPMPFNTPSLKSIPFDRKTTSSRPPVSTDVTLLVQRESGAETHQQDSLSGVSNSTPPNQLTHDQLAHDLVVQATPVATGIHRQQEPYSLPVVRGQDPSSSSGPGRTIQDNQVAPAGYQYPELNNSSPPGSFAYPIDRLGAPNEMNSLVAPYAPGGVAPFPQNYADLDVFVEESQTGRINIGGAYNSDNGLVGQFVIDERNFDIQRFPRSFRDITDGTAWRGGGQGFRMELVPGNQVQRYMINFTEPYFLDTPISLSVSGYLFSRNYFDWNEQRLGGRVALGYRLNHDLSVSAGLRMEDVKLFDPRVNTSTQLNDSLGSTDLYMAQFSLVNDTRDHPFLPTEGSYLSLTYSQAFGEVSFPRGDIEFRKYWLLRARADQSGRHTVSHGTRLGFSGSDTPVFENYYAGGFSTMRGFSFRGVGPTETGVRVGGEFQWLNTLEYMFPLTADDMIRGVVFCDYGTIEEKTQLNWDSFRVAPGFGFRVFMPAAGLGAPLAFDFAFPISRDPNDDTQMFSFYMGLGR